MHGLTNQPVPGADNRTVLPRVGRRVRKPIPLAPMKTKSRFGWPTIVGVLVTIPLLWWTLRDIHFAEVWTFIRDARTLPLLGTLVATVAVYPVRVLRWRALMQRDKPLPFLPLWHATTIGFAINNLLPAPSRRNSPGLRRQKTHRHEFFYRAGDDHHFSAFSMG